MDQPNQILIKCESTICNVPHWYTSNKPPYKTLGLNLCSMCKAQYRGLNEKAYRQAGMQSPHHKPQAFKQAGNDTV